MTTETVSHDRRTIAFLFWSIVVVASAGYFIGMMILYFLRIGQNKNSFRLNLMKQTHTSGVTLKSGYRASGAGNSPDL